MGKRIETVEMKVSDIKTGFGNPRKINKKGLDDLKDSLERFGDFGILLIDEGNNIIAGNQRLKIMREKDPDMLVTCKRLIGYTDNELKAINIKDNTHSGDWDLDLLAQWTADLGLEPDLPKKDVVERKIDQMELLRYEKYDYVIIACKSELDYNNLIRRLGLDKKTVLIAKKRSIKARAVWYDELKVDLVPKMDKEEFDADL